MGDVGGGVLSQITLLRQRLSNGGDAQIRLALECGCGAPQASTGRRCVGGRRRQEATCSEERRCKSRVEAFASGGWTGCRRDKRQMLRELQEQGQRIELHANAGHDLLQGVHAAVKQIRSDVEDVMTTVSEQTRAVGRA